MIVFYLITSLFVVEMKTFILFGIKTLSSNVVVDNFYETSRGLQKRLVIYMSERLLMLTSAKSPVHSYFLFFSFSQKHFFVCSGGI